MSLATKLTTALLAGGVALSLAACAGTSSSTHSGEDTTAAPTATAAALEGSITVFAAASLKSTFTELTEEFEAANPGVTVELNFAGSSDLVTQITEGAPADVFASADEKNMTKLTDAGLIESSAPVDFATNVLEIAVPPSNPAGVASFADLADPAVKTVICAPQVPCGAATLTVEEATGVDITPVSEESSVTDVLGKVTSGEADAGLVYVTDVIAAGDAVEGIEFPESSEAVNVYPIAPVTATENPDAAQAFIDFVTGEVGLGVLAAAGFGQP
ncbi:molybdate ABC transporter substrate-binding protein [Herbiconiux moechotypicola]|uniref:Molybdate ABC transporter substrate-binding protein n=1 Tax=Herbiconiux moechotypicola TaxID=637393 RepID=A0ABP5R0P4_9MICO|nr:molybdate ABC transporter substrate-binding protein [Herbiconiux moechotypicola]MCS5731371.1 molybdate ABC transporter substrate-binding protein [Herbiconiux moechotypicola]